MPEHALLRVADDLGIPLSQIRYRATRSGGPGGQHVNTSSTKARLKEKKSPTETKKARARPRTDD